MIDIEHPNLWLEIEKTHFLKVWQECIPEKLRNNNKIPIIYGTGGKIEIPPNCFKCGIPLNFSNMFDHQENCNFISYDE